MEGSPEVRANTRPPLFSGVPEELIPLSEEVQAAWTKRTMGYTARSVTAWYEMSSDAKVRLAGNFLTLVEAGAEPWSGALDELEKRLTLETRLAWNRRGEGRNDYHKFRELEDRLTEARSPKKSAGETTELPMAPPVHELPVATAPTKKEDVRRRALGRLVFWH